MNSELDEQLCLMFPIIYRDRSEPMDKTALCWGFCCGSGWFSLLFYMSKKLEAIAEKQPAELDKYGQDNRLKAVQIKEKFGTLRAYFNYTSDEVDAIIREAEEESSVTCENCGTHGECRSRGGWLTTLCDKCWDEDCAKRNKA
jgi:hypothetical protein